MKKITALLAALCLIVGLLPTVALAAPPEGWVVDDIAYIKVGNGASLAVHRGTDEVGLWQTDANGVVTALSGANKDAALADGSWNVKLEYIGDVATMTLRNATIGKYNPDIADTEKAFSAGKSHGISVNGPSQNGGNINLTINLEGTNSIASFYSAIAGNKVVGELIVKGQEGASLELGNWGNYYLLNEVANLTFDNAKVSFKSFHTGGGWKAAVAVNNMSVINGSELNYDSGAYGFTRAPFEIKEEVSISDSKVKVYARLSRAINAGKVVVTNSDLDLTIESGLSAIYATESITVTNSKLKAVHMMTSDVDGGRALITSSTADITFKNSEVSLTRAEGEHYYNCYGINIIDEANLVIDGGSVELATNTEDGSYGLYLESGATAAVKGNANVTITGLTHIGDDESMVVESGTVTFSGNKASVEGVLKTTGGTVKYLVEDIPAETVDIGNNGNNGNNENTENTEGNTSTESTKGNESNQGNESTKGNESNQDNESTKGTEANKPAGNTGSNNSGKNGDSVILWIIAVILVAIVVAAAVFVVLQVKKATTVAEAVEEIEDVNAAKEVVEEVTENNEAAE